MLQAPLRGLRSYRLDSMKKPGEAGVYILLRTTGNDVKVKLATTPTIDSWRACSQEQSN